MDTPNTLEMNKFLIILMLFIITLITALNIKMYYNAKNDKKEIHQKSEEYNNLIDSYVAFSKNSSVTCSKSINVISPNGQSLDLYRILDTTDSLIVFRYNENSCTPCVISEIQVIKDCIKDFNVPKVIILCNFEEFDDFVTFCRINQFEGCIYLINNNYFENYYESNAIPYYIFL